MFTEQELQQLIYFLNKATLIGTESLAHAQLLIKIQNLAQKQETE
jgi:hypothetical protein